MAPNDKLVLRNLVALYDDRMADGPFQVSCENRKTTRDTDLSDQSINENDDGRQNIRNKEPSYLTIGFDISQLLSAEI